MKNVDKWVVKVQKSQHAHMLVSCDGGVAKHFGRWGSKIFWGEGKIFLGGGIGKNNLGWCCKKLFGVTKNFGRRSGKNLGDRDGKFFLGVGWQKIGLSDLTINQRRR